MENQGKRLFSKGDPILKPQNQFSLELRKQIKDELFAWMIKCGSVPYHARLFASYLCQEAISDRIEQTSPKAADVFLTDKDKIFDIVLESKKLAKKLDTENKVDQIISNLERLDAQGEGNSL